MQLERGEKHLRQLIIDAVKHFYLLMQGSMLTFYILIVQLEWEEGGKLLWQLVIDVVKCLSQND